MEHRVVYTRPYDTEVGYIASTGTQWIDTEASEGTLFKFKFKISNNSTTDIKVFGNKKAYPGYAGLALYQGYFRGTSIPALSDVWYDVEMNVKMTSPSLMISDGSTSEVASNWWQYNGNYPPNTDYGVAMPIFGIIDPSGTNYNGNYFISVFPRYVNTMYFAYFQAYNDGVLIRDLIPVRIGQIGYMYDKVSGKLFGNKGTGNFILGPDVANPVPNIRRVFRFGNKRFVIPMSYVLKEGVDYQRYDWLKGDGTAYMTDTTENSFSSDLYNLDFGDIKIFDSTQKVGLFYNWVTGSSYYAYLKYLNSSMKFMWGVTNQGYNISVTVANGNLLIKPNIVNTSSVNGICINNDKSYKIGNTRYFRIGTVGSAAQISAPAGIGITQFVQSYVSDGTIRRELKPCKLLRSIHASFDANRITRQSGECGMIDLISGKFFGNVAASGSSTVSND